MKFKDIYDIVAEDKVEEAIREINGQIDDITSPYGQYIRMGRRLAGKMAARGLASSGIARKRFEEINVYLYGNGEEFMFPVYPQEMKLGSPYGITKVESITEILSFIDKKQLGEVQFSSFFPGNLYNFAKYKEDLLGWDFVDKVERMRASNEELQIIMTGTGINLKGYISDLSLSPEPNGDINFSLSFEERRTPDLEENTPTTEYYKPSEIKGIIHSRTEYSKKDDAKPEYKDPLKEKHKDFAQGAIWK